jgi:hypothetical protein
MRRLINRETHWRPKPKGPSATFEVSHYEREPEYAQCMRLIHAAAVGHFAHEDDLGRVVDHIEGYYYVR